MGYVNLKEFLTKKLTFFLHAVSQILLLQFAHLATDLPPEHCGKTGLTGQGCHTIRHNLLLAEIQERSWF